MYVNRKLIAGFIGLKVGQALITNWYGGTEHVLNVLWRRENVLKLDYGDGCTKSAYTKKQ